MLRPPDEWVETVIDNVYKARRTKEHNWIKQQIVIVLTIHSQYYTPNSFHRKKSMRAEEIYRRVQVFEPEEHLKQSRFWLAIHELEREGIVQEQLKHSYYLLYETNATRQFFKSILDDWLLQPQSKGD